MPAGHPDVSGAPAQADGSPLPAGHPPSPAKSQGSTSAAGGPSGRAGKPRQTSEGAEDQSLPPGSLRVRVVDHRERPVPGADIRLGILKSDSSRESRQVKSDQDGRYLFTDLPVGDRQAYRVSIDAGGARFSSTPFRMPHKHGYQTLIRQMPTTRDRSQVVLYVGAVSVELKDERLKVVQQLRLVNIGGQVYVLPEDGLQMRLPQGHTAFQAQETMGDQRIEADETHARIEGSIPAGETTLLFGYDVPIEGSEKVIEVDNPFLTFAYRVLADAPEGMTLAVDGMPEARLHEDGGKRYWVTERSRHPDQEGLRRIVIRIGGIPGPGPMRWIAVALSGLALLVGFSVSRRPPATEVPVDGDALAIRRKSLLREVKTLEAERAADAIGPEYYSEERARLTDELALVLSQLARLSNKSDGRPASENRA